MTEEQKLERKKKKTAEKRRLVIEQEKNQRPVSEITITIEWKKSYMWGSNPHCEAQIKYKESDGLHGLYGHSPKYTCSGCGYDKESTVIADVFNDYLKYKLWKMSPEEVKGGHGSGDVGPVPYGINYRVYKDEDTEYRSYSGGIGTDCYYRISEHIGGKFEHVAWGKTFDVYKYTDNE